MIFPGINSLSSPPKIAPHAFICTSYIQILAVHVVAAEYFNQCHMWADRNGAARKNIKIPPQEVMGCAKIGCNGHFTAFGPVTGSGKLPSAAFCLLPFISCLDFPTALL